MASIEALLDQPSSGPSTTFREAEFVALPPAARLYLSHSIAEGTRLVSAVHLQMTGEIKLERWLPFTASQVVRIERGFVWTAKVKKGLAFISGFDQLLDGVGESQWKLLGLFKVMSASGPDISRSTQGRMAIERIMLPSSLARPDVAWSDLDGSATAVSRLGDFDTTLKLDLSGSGKLEAASLLRWGNPDGGPFKLSPFGGFTDEEMTFGGYTIPTRLRIGWHFGTDRFSEGEFFRCKITSAEFHQ
jgi:hypothetical protein